MGMVIKGLTRTDCQRLYEAAWDAACRAEEMMQEFDSEQIDAIENEVIAAYPEKPKMIEGEDKANALRLAIYEQEDAIRKRDNIARVLGIWPYGPVSPPPVKR